MLACPLLDLVGVTLSEKKYQTIPKRLRIMVITAQSEINLSVGQLCASP